MTNREWLNTLSNEDFAKWCLKEETVRHIFDKSKNISYEINEPTPKLETIRKEYTSSYDGLLKWLNEERRISNDKEKS